MAFPESQSKASPAITIAINTSSAGQSRRHSSQPLLQRRSLPALSLDLSSHSHGRTTYAAAVTGPPQRPCFTVMFRAYPRPPTPIPRDRPVEWVDKKMWEAYPRPPTPFPRDLPAEGPVGTDDDNGDDDDDDDNDDGKGNEHTDVDWLWAYARYKLARSVEGNARVEHPWGRPLGETDPSAFCMCVWEDPNAERPFMPC